LRASSAVTFPSGAAAADDLRMRLEHLGVAASDEPVMAGILRQLEGIPLASTRSCRVCG